MYRLRPFSNLDANLCDKNNCVSPRENPDMYMLRCKKPIEGTILCKADTPPCDCEPPLRIVV